MYSNTDTQNVLKKGEICLYANNKKETVKKHTCKSNGSKYGGDNDTCAS